jgi:hypothetical protein
MKMNALSLLAVVGLLFAAPAQAADGTIVLEGKFGEVKQEHKVTVDDPAGVEMLLKVRVDQLTSSDPDFQDATITMYEYGENASGAGTYRVYGVISAAAGKAIVEYTGSWSAVMKDGEFVEAPFSAEGKVVGGTGAFENISGTLKQSGKVTPAEGGVYTLELTTSD